MPNKNIRLLKPGPNNTLIGENGQVITPPPNWSFLAAGDAGITRKVTAKGEYWRVQSKKGKRLISKGIWAPTLTIIQAKELVQATRNTEVYQKKRISEIKRREKKQQEYEQEFQSAVVDYLAFHEKYRMLEKKMAIAITKHAIPVGSGTVARTAMIPIEERAAKAVIAWMRHQTTAYDHTPVARIKGERRAIRRKFAQQSVTLLEKYRNGEIVYDNCPLYRAIQETTKQN
jgi:hypothetical protein